MPSGHSVITTIQAPTACVLQLAATSAREQFTTLAIGDGKSPDVPWPAPLEFVALPAQRDLGFRLAALLPEGHYARKNLGYLIAAQRKAPVIFDTDDDNAPLASWSPRRLQVQARPCLQRGWVNAYAWFSDEHIWPRGLPLGEAHIRRAAAPLGAPAQIDAPIQQGLANGAPDVDAVWRMLFDRAIDFRAGESVSLPPGSWCPFNSQSTWWFPQAFPLMYLPSRVSFRMTDIWRSFVAQRCLWAAGHSLVFHGAEVRQDRNPHNLQRDFEQEVPGYMDNERIRLLLENLSLPGGAEHIGGNLHRCYEALVEAGIVPREEMPLVQAWLADVTACSGLQERSS